MSLRARARTATRVLPIVLASLTFGLPAAGQASADDALRQGTELRKRGQDAQALSQFQRANELEPSPRARAQIGLAEQALGRWVNAEADLVEALRAGDDPWIAHNVASLRRALERIRQHLGTLEIETNVANAEIVVDGTVLGRLPMVPPPRVVAGVVVVEVRADGYVPVRRTIAVVAGNVAHEPIRLVPTRTGLEEGINERIVRPGPPEARTAVASPPKADGRGRPTAAYVALATGAALVGAGVSAHAVALHAAESYNDDARCSRSGTYRDDVCGGERATAETGRVFAIAAYAGGAVLVGTAAVLFLTTHRRSATVRTEVQIGAGALWVRGSF